MIIKENDICIVFDLKYLTNVSKSLTNGKIFIDGRKIQEFGYIFVGYKCTITLYFKSISTDRHCLLLLFPRPNV